MVYGGTFDPPHEGHMLLLSAAARRLRPAAVWLLPALRSPLKSAPAESFDDRTAMLRAAAAEAGVRAGVSLFEKRRGRTTYTWQAIEYFRSLHPRAELYFLMGSDCLPGFPRWRRTDRILASARLLVGRRAGFPRGAGREFSPVFLDGTFPEESSTSLRAALYCGDAPAGVPAAAMRIIRRRGLYLGRLREGALRRLGPARARHTLACARLACAIAAARGTDPRAAAAAALIHDYAKEMTPEELVRESRRRGLRIPCFGETARRAPQLLHSWVSAALAREELGVDDPAVLRAAARHTLGHPSMGELDRTIFVADMAAGDRSFPGVAGLRRLALRDLDAAAALAARLKVGWLRRSGKWIHPLGLETCLCLNP